MKKEQNEIKFYQSSIGMPFATQGRYIAKWIGKDYQKNKDFFARETIKQFEKKHFPVSKLNVITNGMPIEYKRGLTKALRG